MVGRCILSISWLAFLLDLLISQTCAEYEPAYFKVCSKTNKHEFDSTDCEKGIWLRGDLEPSCVCVRGVWAISEGFCDDNARLLVGDGHCFHVPYKIRSVKLIGDPKDPFKPAVYMVPESLDAVYEVQEGSYTPPIQNDHALIVGVNPRQVAQRKDRLACVDLSPERYNLPVHIYRIPRRTSKEWTLDKKQEYRCPNIEEYEVSLAFGEIYHRGKREKKLFVERHCKSDCPGASAASIMGRTIGGETGDFEPAAGGGPSTAVLVSGRKRPLKTMEERNQEKEEMRARTTEDPGHYEQEVNEQTLRMMHAHISPLLLNITGPQVVTHEYRYFQEIRQVAEKACPNDFVPKNLLKGLMRMFRQLLFETQESYFQHIQNNNEEQFNKILERLQECTEKTPDPAVLFATYTDSFKPNATPPMAPPGPERCPEPLMYGVNGSNYNRTDINLEKNLYLKNLTDLFYPHLKFNASQVDFVIETAWKITMIGHYRCSKYFDAQTAAEFSHFFHQVQSFFNPRIIKRWYYEKSIEATYDIVRMIFPSYDLKRFMFGLDTCLLGTQGFSLFDYTNIWLQRPKIPMTENDLSQKKHVLPGATSRLTTLDYAPDRNMKKGKEGVLSKQDTKSPAKKKGSRRRRRGVSSSGYHLWSQTARCIEDYMDPVTKHTEFHYRLPNGCIPPMAVN